METIAQACSFDVLLAFWGLLTSCKLKPLSLMAIN